MAPPPMIEDPSHDSRRAKVRIGVAAALLATAIGILSALNQRRAEAPAEPEAAAPAAQASISSADKEVPPPALPAIGSPAAAAESATVVPPPPPVPGELPETASTASAPAPSGTREQGEGAHHVQAAVTAQPAPGSAPATPPSQPAGAAAPKAYAVQLGVFSDPENARQLQSKLAQHGIPSRTETRVQIGPFKTRAEADRAKEKMKALGITAVVLDK